MSTQNTASSSLPTQRLLGKVALITGGATGIGESIVHLFHKHGAKVCIVDLQDELGDKLCNRLAVDSACFIHGDVTVEDDISKAVNFTVNRFGTLDILINNAGLSGAPCPDIRNNSLSEFNTVFDVNVEGAFPRDETRSSCNDPGQELGQHGIRVNCVSPYAVVTKLALAHLPEEERTDDALVGFRNFAAANANLKGVELTVDDVANVVLFLASDESRYVSGDNLMIDGGFTCTSHSFKVFR
ncbi:hypothetical protein BRARA_H00170 [Brassica rapa]|uniref:3-oxoacyl-[acyl-carrier-protein] reductase n=1 Tax=Brassica campestris TaxID=3711 RepID=A0A397Y7Y4_BRACM|nr:hypothetical protein BRARA_H00170 [Brassica rapa]